LLGEMTKDELPDVEKTKTEPALKNANFKEIFDRLKK
jgi:hypothetical protein